MLTSVVLVLALTQFDQRFALTWNVPCAPVPDVQSLLGTADGEAVVTIAPVESRWHLEVAFVTPASGIRQLDAPTCEDAAKAALLFLKLGATAQPDRTPVLIRPPEPEPPPAEAPPPPPPIPKAPLVLDLSLELGALANVGALPPVTPRIAASLGLGTGSIAGFLGLRAGVPSSFAGGPGSARISVHPALGAQLSGCFLLGRGRVRAGPCAVVLVEWWRLAGLQVDFPRSGSEVWLAAGADGRLFVNLTRGLYAFFLAGVRFSLRRPQLLFEDFGVAFAVPLVSGEGTLGLGWQW